MLNEGLTHDNAEIVNKFLLSTDLTLLQILFVDIHYRHQYYGIFFNNLYRYASDDTAEKLLDKIVKVQPLTRQEFKSCYNRRKSVYKKKLQEITKNYIKFTPQALAAYNEYQLDQEFELFAILNPARIDDASIEIIETSDNNESAQSPRPQECQAEAQTLRERETDNTSSDSEPADSPPNKRYGLGIFDHHRAMNEDELEDSDPYLSNCRLQ